MRTVFTSAVGLMIVLGGLPGWVSAASAPKKDIEALYTKQCSICHGDKGDGQSRARGGMDPKPRDFTTAEAAMELTRERMIASVTHGRPGTAMVAHEGRLTETQIADLVDFIRTNFMRVPMAKEGGLPESQSLGEKVYTKNCSVCHGDKGNTAFWAKNGLNPPPRDFTSPEAQAVLSRERMIHSVTNGRPGTGMMPFSSRLSAEEIAAVVGYIRFIFMGIVPDQDTGAAPLANVEPKAEVDEVHADTSHGGGIPGVDTPLSAARPESAATDPHQGPHTQMPEMPVAPSGMPATGAMPQGHSMTADMSLPIPNDLKGDVQWGREFYMKNCFTCHGVKGDGNGPRAYFNIPRPRNFTSEASRSILNRPRIFDSVTKGKVGTVMPAWGKVLSEQEIANVAEFVFQAFIQGKGAGETGAEKQDDSKKKAG